MAITSQRSSRVILFNLNDRFNIQSSDIEVRAIEWIGNALREMNQVAALLPCHTDVVISNYRGKLPCDARYVRGYEVNAAQIDVTYDYNINRHDPINLIAFDGTEQSYELNKNGYIVSTLKDDTVRIHYLSVASEFDNELGIDIPLIPDDENTMEALLWNVLYKWLGRGNTHSVYKLGAQNPILDPYQMWIKYKMKAKNSVNRMSRDEREQHRQIWNTMIHSNNRARQI